MTNPTAIPVEIPCLDHGFVRLIDTMGDDASIVQAARISYGTGTKTPSEDRALIRYLMSHHHTTPFEMCEIKLHVKMPIFVARQLVRHRTASINEYSARYSVLDNEYYVPLVENMGMQSKDNKQGQGETDSTIAKAAQVEIDVACKLAYRSYEKLLETGVAREIARMVLPVNFYTQWYWKMNLHNLFHMLSLRLDSHAQYETRVYAEAIAGIVKTWVPDAWKTFEDYRLEAKTFSRSEMVIVYDMVNNFTLEQHDLSDREFKGIFNTFNIDPDEFSIMKFTGES